MKRSPAVDTLRGLAVAMVVAFHYFGMANSPFRMDNFFGWAASGGWIGVELFFVLSGYLLGGQLLSGRITVSAFYVRRASRTLPLYVILLAVAAPSIPTLWPYLTMTQNLIPAAGASMTPEWMGPTWSLAVEDQFYLALPAIILLVPRRRLSGALAAIMVLSIATWWLPGSYYSLGGCAAPLAGGVLLAQLPSPRLPLPSFAPLAWLGRRAYPVYLFHFLVADLTAVSGLGGVAAPAAAISITLGLAVVLHAAVERPIHDWARSAAPPRSLHCGTSIWDRRLGT